MGEGGESKRTTRLTFWLLFPFFSSSQLNQQLKDRFGTCKEGARIVSSLNFSPLTFTINQRNL